MQTRAVIHIKLDALFIDVETAGRPSLAGRPVVVGGSGDAAARGVVSAVSGEARSAGVRPGMELRAARKLCPGAEFLPVDLAACEAASGRFMEILGGYGPLVESFGLDEAFVEVKVAGGGGGEENFDSAVAIAREIKARVKRDLGLGASLGVGPNKLLALLASGMKGPGGGGGGGGFFVIRAGEAAGVLRDLPVGRLPGVGPGTAARLRELGAPTIGELARIPYLHLERNFGPDRARTLFDQARGIDTSPVVPFLESGFVGREATFDRPAGDAYIIKETLFALSEDVTARLKAGGLRAGTVAIKVGFRDLKTITKSMDLASVTDSMNDIWGAASRLLEGTDLTGRITLVGVKAGGLEGR
ncbi:MAG: DNA polymerase IV [Thermodesulfobacteriota bacterium]